MLIKPALGILGGTFDPIHIGHVRMGLEILTALQLSHVHFIPCYEPVHREPTLATASARFKMVQLALQPLPQLVADECEIRRNMPSYTIDTLLELRAAMPHTPLCLIIGADAFAELTTWHRYLDIFVYAHLIVAHRPGHRLPSSGRMAQLLQERRQTDPRFFHAHLAGGIFCHPIPALEISATEIREQFASGKDPRYLLPDSVYAYITKHALYRITK